MMLRSAVGIRLMRLLAIAMVSLCLAAAAGAAERYAEIRLRDGRVLHDAEIRSDQPASVTILCKEGLLSVEKRMLPPEIAARHPRRASQQRAPSTLRASGATQDSQAKRRSAVSACRIVSVTGRDGFADLVLQNDTDRPFRFRSLDLICRTTEENTFLGRFMTTVPPDRSLDDVEAPRTMYSKYKSLTIPGRSSRTVRVVFFDQDPKAPKSIATVRFDQSGG